MQQTAATILDFQTSDLSRSSPLWLNVMEHLALRFGGVVATVPRLLQETQRLGHSRAELASFCDEDEGLAENTVHTHVFPLSRKTWFTNSGERRRFSNLISRAQGVHIHGLWQEHCRAAAHWAATQSKPYIVSAHGMLEPWALRNRRWRKELYALLVERRNLQKAFCLRALTEAEALQYRGFGFRGRIAVIPNGVDFPVRPSPELLLRRYPELQGKRVVLFLGRFHRKKGLDLLIPAWRTVASQSPDAHLLLAGPDSDGTLAEAKSAVAGHGLRSSVTFTGALNGDLKMSALACASGFVLPSRSEGFSAAVLEALASGVPAVITNNCNFHEVATHRCGWVVQQETKEIAAALRQLLDISPSEHESMRINACRLIASKFTWARVAQQMDQLYAWALGGNPPTLVQVL